MAGLLRNVVNWFTDAEKNLYEFLGFVPYCDEHKNVWSPRLVTIFLDVCSQMDSLWSRKMDKNKTDPNRENPCIVDYFVQFGSDISSKWAVFWGESGEKVQPFSPWSSLTASDYCSKNVQKGSAWEGNASNRFKAWFYAYENK